MEKRNHVVRINDIPMNIGRMSDEQLTQIQDYCYQRAEAALSDAATISGELALRGVVDVEWPQDLPPTEH